MLRKLAVALIATSLIAGPALAQGTAPATGTSQPAAQADAVKATPVKKTVKKMSNKRHVAKHVTHVKHVKHVKNVKNLKNLKRPAKSNTAS